MSNNLILLLLCAQIFLIQCYHLNRIQKRHTWPNLDAESSDEYLTKLSHNEGFFDQGRSPIHFVEQLDAHPEGLQKRGRQCLWKVCSWALDKRSSI